MPNPTDDADDLMPLAEATFGYFLHEAHPETGLVPDSTRDGAPCSIAATGLGLACYPVAVERGWVERGEAVRRVTRTLATFRDGPQSPEPDAMGYKGFYYHFLDPATGRRAWDCELSTIDTTFLVAGMLSAAMFFDGDSAEEREVRAVADALYRRVDWAWALYGVRSVAGWPAEKEHRMTVSHGGTPENGFISYSYRGYDEALLLHVLGLGSPTHPLPPECYTAWQGTFDWRELYGVGYVHAGPLFIHQLSHCWLDLRGIADEYMRGKGIDYFENSRRATLVQSRHCAANPDGWKGYGEHAWGVTATDGPGESTHAVDGREREFFGYLARGVPDGPDDGTLAPWAVAASLPFAPDLVRASLRHVDATYPQMQHRYGFKCSYNPTFPADSDNDRQRGPGWVSRGYLGLDQGPVVLMAENHATGLPWGLMRRCPYVRRGLERAGFAGGWLDGPAGPHPLPEGAAAADAARQAEVGDYRPDCSRPDRADEGAPPMTAFRLTDYGEPPTVRQAARPAPGDRQVLVRVRAAGVNPLDGQIADGRARSWLDHPLPMTLGWELAGTVESVGGGVDGWEVGDAVYAMLDLFSDGCHAEYAVVGVGSLAKKPESLGFEPAAALPVGALTAWAALFDAGRLEERQTVLIHAAAGGVGSLAVQLAKHRGATVVGTGSPASRPVMEAAGVDRIIDYTAVDFWDEVHGVDLVIDPIGGETQERSYGVLRRGGRLVSLVQQPDATAARTRGVEATMVGVRPDGARLANVAELVKSGDLRPFVDTSYPLSDAADALDHVRTGRVHGKVVLTA